MQVFKEETEMNTNIKYELFFFGEHNKNHI